MEAIRCPICGAETGTGFRLCGACGTPLEGAPAVEEIQRFATVVTSDLKGSTALGERLDPESLREVLGLYFEDMQAVFRSHGGTIEKIIGDAIVAVFGLPVRHDDDALRAVEAAAETQRVLANLNDRLDELWGVRLVVRTGIATGVVVFGEASLGQHVLTGDTMQAASAMEQNAPPFEVLIAHSTYELVRDSVTVSPAEPVTPKGTNAAILAYRLDSVVARPEAGRARADTAAAGLQLCPTCGEENPPVFRLCGMCGSTLAASVAFRESRKTVTIVFADPKPSTVGGERPTAEALRDVMSRYFEVMRTALEAHGGTVEKFIGDAVMAVYGLPVRHEDDALRAVRGASAMQAALPALNEEFRDRWGIELGNHIGVNSGEVIAGDASLGQRLVTGDAVNTAARLEQAAGAHEVILGALTYRLARDEIEVEPIEPLMLKGKAEPVPAYRLVRVGQRPTERADPTTPFVGREAELTRLETTLVAVSATQSCELLTVIGDAGVGKSRLVREFAARAAQRDRSQVLRGRCLPYGDGVTFWPIYEIVRAAAGIADEDPREVALAKISEIARRTVAGDDDAAMVVERVAAAIGLSDTPFPGPELFWGIRKLLEAIASRRPLVAIIDDIHVAAPTFLELLDHLLESVHGSPILLLTTARRELLEVRSEWAEAHEYDHMLLDPLSADESDSIVARLLGGLEGSVRDRITAAAEGNPLYVEQIAAMLIETGAIRQEGEGWVASGTSSEIDIPPTIQALVAARLDALRSEERQVVDPASVIGLGFAVDALTHLIPEEAASQLADRLTSLTHKQFVRPLAAESDFYRFGHAVIKDAAYRSLLKRARAELHERFVDWAEPVNRERGREVEFEEILGYHLEQAYRYRTELGPLDDRARGLAERAASKLGNAGRRALDRSDLSAATDLLARAINLYDAPTPARVELRAELSEAFVSSGTLDEARSAARAAVADAAELDDLRLKMIAQVADSSVDVLKGDVRPEVTLERASAAITLFEAARDRAQLAWAWRLRSRQHNQLGRSDEAADDALRAAEYGWQSGDVRIANRSAMGYAANAVNGSDPVPEVAERLRALLDRVRGDRKAESVILGALAQLLAMDGKFDEARAMSSSARDLLLELGPSALAFATSTESYRVEVSAGDLGAAEALLRRDDIDLERIGETYFRSTVLGRLANVAALQGRAVEAGALAERAESLANDDDTEAQILWRTAKARSSAGQLNFDRAVSLAREAVDIATTTGSPLYQADAEVTLADVLLAAGEPGAVDSYRRAHALYTAKGDRISAVRLLDTIQGILA